MWDCQVKVGRFICEYETRMLLQRSELMMAPAGRGAHLHASLIWCLVIICNARDVDSVWADFMSIHVTRCVLKSCWNSPASTIVHVDPGHSRSPSPPRRLKDAMGTVVSHAEHEQLRSFKYKTLENMYTKTALCKNVDAHFTLSPSHRGPPQDSVSMTQALFPQ